MASRFYLSLTSMSPAVIKGFSAVTLTESALMAKPRPSIPWYLIPKKFIKGHFENVSRQTGIFETGQKGKCRAGLPRTFGGSRDAGVLFFEDGGQPLLVSFGIRRGRRENGALFFFGGCAAPRF